MGRNTDAWKRLERDVATALGGVRRGSQTSRNGKGLSDVVHDAFSIECKLRAVPHFGDAEKAVQQAEIAAEGGQMPIAVVKRKGDKLDDAMVCMSFSSFVAWHGDEPYEEDTSS